MNRLRTPALMYALLGIAAAWGFTLGAAAPAHAQIWSEYAMVSATMGVSDGRICMGEGSRGDIGCPGYAPYVDRTTGNVGIGISTPNTSQGHVLHVYNDGDTTSPATGNTALLLESVNRGANVIIRSADTATSGLIWRKDNIDTSVSDTAITSRPALGLLFTVSGTIRMRMLPTGSIGIGTSAPQSLLHVSGTIQMADSGESCDANHTGAIKYQSGDFFYCRNGTAWESLTSLSGSGTAGDRITSGTTGVYTYSNTSASIATAGVERVVVGTNGNVGIGQQPNASATFAISGTTILAVPEGTLGLGINTTSAADILNVAVAPSPTGLSKFGLRATTNGVSYGARYLGYLEQGIGSGAIIETIVSGVATERLRITSDGNVGIGTSTPSANLAVSGTGAFNRLTIENVSTNTHSLLVRGDTQDHTTVPFGDWQGNGQLIITGRTGSTNSDKRLALGVDTTQSTMVSLIQSMESGIAPRDLSLNPTGGNVGVRTASPSATLHVSGTIRIADGGETCDANRAGALKYSGGNFYACNGSAWSALGTAAGVVSDRITSGTTGVYTYTNASATIATAGVERVVVGTNGNIGIGSQPTTVQMTVYTSSSSTNGLAVQNASGGTASIATMSLTSDVGSGALNYYSSNFNAGAWAQPNTLELVGYSTTEAIQLRSSSANGFIRFMPAGSVERMRIVSSGNVGIGTSSPTAKLDVSGTVSATLVKLANDPADACTAATVGAIKSINGRIYVCRQ